MLKYKLLKEMLNYKLLEGHSCHYKNLVNGDVKVQIVKRDNKL